MVAQNVGYQLYGVHTGITLLLGLVLGNLIHGLPINKEHEFTGTLLTFF